MEIVLKRVNKNYAFFVSVLEVYSNRDELPSTIE